MPELVTVIRTIGTADLEEEIFFYSRDQLIIGDLIDLKVTKPNDAPVYGQARIVGYEGIIRPGRLNKFKSIRIL